MQNNTKRLMACLLLACGLAASAQDWRLPSRHPQVYPGIKPVMAMDDLYQLQLPNTRIVKVEQLPGEDIVMVTAGVNHPPTDDNVWVWVTLPISDWNGRMLGRGGAGFTGGDWQSEVPAARNGFVSVGTSTGHDGGSGVFALDTLTGRPRWQLIRDFAYQGVHDMTVVAKAVAEAFYGKPVAYSYFEGISTGGRMGMMEAQRFPDDYDGIFAGCPAINMPELSMAMMWPDVAMRNEGHYLTLAKLEAARQAVIAACDAYDGAVDGVIDDPLSCRWDARQMVGTRVGDDTFTDADARLMNMLWDGPRAADGSRLWWGLARGSNFNEIVSTTGNPPEVNRHPQTPDWIKYFLTLDPHFDYSCVDYALYEHFMGESAERYDAVIGTRNPDLTAFRQHGGKLLVVHGLTDHLIPPMGTVDYFERVFQMLGGEEGVSSFARLFLLPGLDHVYRGTSPQPVNTADVLIDWVEHGVAPDVLHCETTGGDGAKSRDIAYYRPSLPATWNGGVRHDFKFMGRDAVIVEPTEAAPGRPWIFRPAFFDAFAWVDAALLEQGFHVVYCDFTHEFACPESMEQGLAFYDYVTRELHLSPRVTLEGLSRGAYWCFNWAARHPDKVACLYVDAPLCHMISNENSDNDEFFQDFLRKWKLKRGTVVTADFKANTKRLLPKLRKGRVPIIGVCGDSDRVVPYEENLQPLEADYKAMGGEIQVIVKPGCDHHPHSLEQPTPIVEFIMNHQNRTK